MKETKPINPEALIEFVKLLAWCPCCNGTFECIQECTFEEDSIRTGHLDALQTQTRARDALKEAGVKE